MRAHTHRSHGFTLLELLVVCACVALVFAACTPVNQQARLNGLRLKDATQLRNIMQGFQQFAAANRNKYPLPRTVDRFNDTEGSPLMSLAGHGPSDYHKNRTGAILSIMIFNDLFTPEICVSPADTGNVRIFDEYQFQRPDGANTPGRATYDPAFNGTPFDSANDPHCPNNVAANGGRDDISHNSYAHNCVAFGRASDWTNTSSASTPVWANRGPVYENDTRAAYVPNAGAWNVLKSDALGDQSNAVLIWGSNSQWAGNIAMADSHVSFETTPQPAAVTFNVTDQSGQRATVADNIFVDEHFELSDPNDHASRRNAYLRQWKRGIPTNLDPAKFDYATYLAPTGDATGFAYTD